MAFETVRLARDGMLIDVSFSNAPYATRPAGSGV